ncbi:multidrug ABC transporter permease [Streptomyces sp. CBMA152]|nr:multidrug ABC transporter permease [Streptomyces sp. CBMA152]
MVAAWLTKLVLDHLVEPGKGYAAMPWLAAGLAATGVMGAALPRVTGYLTAELERRVGLLATDRLYQAVARFSGLSRFEEPAFLNRLRLAQQAGGRTPAQAVNGTFALAQYAISVAGLFASLIVLSPVMAAVVVAAALPALAAQLALSRRRARTIWGVGVIERREMFYAGLLTSVQAAAETRLFGSGKFLHGRMMAERTAANSARRALDRRELLIQVVLAVFSATVAGAGLVWAIHQAARGALTVGDLSLFLATVAGVQSGLSAMVNEAALLHQQLLLFKHYLAVHNADDDLPAPVTPHSVPPLREGIELRDVWFRYSDEHPWVLRGLNLFIPAAGTTALVGSNGCGKSTVVKLVTRLYDPTRGAIYWDGVNVRNLPAAELRRRISTVFQDFMCYDLTAAENIVLADVGAERTRLGTAARDAGIDAALTALPDGYDTLLSRTYFSGADDDSTTGVVLSGGQWQRLAVARAFLRAERDVFILDEPSASLDAAAEREIQERLADLSHGRTTLMISHRLGTLRTADQIVVLADGQIAEQGDHVSLMADEGIYARLFRLQAKGYAEPGLRSGDALNGDATRPARPRSSIHLT